MEKMAVYSEGSDILILWELRIKSLPESETEGD